MKKRNSFIYPEIASLLEAKQEVEQLLKETTIENQKKEVDIEDHLQLLDASVEWLQMEISSIHKIQRTFRWIMTVFLLMALASALWIRYR